ncbi:bifunctional lysine-specific demethylase and histidyl-hydroxylase NO66 [Phoenix dactylifera]|uniref:Bifunctional lysine-specific demethylase and histidyl-hydroxylase NO66 n=1 Tax=Phoenix dactylifera TaxID=42345 RepID=A0A8B7CMP6_PHODC|nr:bifunctional lysine-specific demethylase and histidyl-hydroxylase NO66 [Phoenix dactylifera]
MGCFLACFGGAKDRKRRRPGNKTLSVDRVCESYKPLRRSPTPKQLTPSPPKKPVSEAVLDSTSELRDNYEQGSFSSSKKKVTFDLNVRTYAEILVDEDPGHSSEDNKEDEATGEGRKTEEGDGKSIPKSGAAFPSKHRYQNCGSSDDDDDGDDIGYGDEEEDFEEEEDYEDSDLDEEDGAVIIEGNEEESYDSFFSLPMEKEHQCIQEVNSPKPKSVSSPDRQPSLLAIGTARDRSQYVHSVLNPVENLTQWKEVKVRAAPMKNPKKENINSVIENKMTFTPESTFKIEKFEKLASSNPSPNCPAKQDVAVDASLSNWLVSSDNSTKEDPQKSNSHFSNSSVSREDRPILGALTVEDLKQSSVTSSPRRSPSRSPDEIPIVGTVGSYWSCINQRSDSGSSCQSGSEIKGIPNTTSKYKEDKRVNWHATPFEVRLERALNKGAAA